MTYIPLIWISPNFSSISICGGWWVDCLTLARMFSPSWRPRQPWCTCSTHRCGGLRHSEPAGRENQWFNERSESEGTNLCLKWQDETRLFCKVDADDWNNKEILAQFGPDWGGGLTVRPAQSGSSLTGLEYRWEAIGADEGELQSTVQIVASTQLRRRKEREFNSTTSL